jgi:hypothetical protein
MDWMLNLKSRTLPSVRQKMKIQVALFHLLWRLRSPLVPPGYGMPCRDSEPSNFTSHVQPPSSRIYRRAQLLSRHCITGEISSTAVTDSMHKVTGEGKDFSPEEKHAKFASMAI